MLLVSEREMERRPETALKPEHPPRPGRTKRETTPMARERKHKANKSVKLQEPHRRKEKVKGEESGEEDVNEDKKDGAVMSRSTVVNVDSVRERAKEESEELLGLLESEWHEEALKPQNLGVCELLLTIVALATVIFFFPISIWFCIKIVREHERAVVFRLGHLLQRKPRGPGLLFYLPFLDVCQKVDIRLKMLQVPSHTVVTKDLVCTEVSAVCYYHIENVFVCYSSLAGVPAVLQALMQVSVREVLAQHTFTHILQNRSSVAQEIQVVLDSIAGRWGIKVERAEIEDVLLPRELQQNFAVEAEAKRQAQIRVIAAEGEKAACEALKASIDSLSDSPLAMQLRLLQLLHTLRSDQPAVVLNLPSDLLSQTLQLKDTASSTSQNQPTGGSTETAKDSPMM
ncbi:podocin [Pygocentrus nattereri]|uniref:Podocin n=1 Tax=Pygocentrus nattereri TaxID=42514 RepID=A0A3B4CWW5_PYGNA|nr:podocin [Pygocentrus nattereri]